MKTILAAATAAVALAAAAPASAATTVYTDLAAFTAATAANTVEDFADTTLVNGLTFSSNVGNIGGGVFNDRLVENSAETTFNFAGGTSAFGANFDLTPGGAGLGIELVLTLVGGGTEVVSSQVSRDFSGQFFGFTSTNAFSSVLLRAGTQGGSAETYNLDNLRFAATSAGVPEPATWGLMILGFGAVGGALRTRRKGAVAAA